MRKYCWVYKHRKTGEVVVVQRPRRRAVDPTYSVGHYRRVQRDMGYMSYENVPAREFRARYVYVGRLPKEYQHD